MKKSVKITENIHHNAQAPNHLNWWILFSVIVVVTVLTRFYKVTEPDHVCWDETHFGKMGSWYINRTFFFDVHPPLGKMLIALSGKLTGYDGTFPFEKPGDKYNGTSYEGMRIFCTALGALISPMVYVTVYDLTLSLTAAGLAALLILCDVGLLTLNQYILLDPLLLCFMTGSVMGMVKVSKYTRDAPFHYRWWTWLAFTGAMLAATISVKFVGLFVVLLVGLSTVNDLWVILGDLSKPVLVTVKHLLARALLLIIWPALLYALFFYIHLKVLNKSGNGDGFYSSAFQSQLIGNSLHNASMPRQVAYGAIITLKNHRTGGGYLHSHHHLYPEGFGARQQQITTYTHKDENNKWLIKPYEKKQSGSDAGTEVAAKGEVKDVHIVKNGDLVILEHVSTKRNVHSHREKAPLTKKHYQVTGYGENGTGDANDIWKILIMRGGEKEEVTTVTTKLILVHFLQNCALTASGKQLPKWGFEQQEVSCNPNIRDANAVWNVEDNAFDKLPNVSFEVYAPGFLERFLESHAVMFQGNAGLKPKEGEVTSRPWQWPINYRGQFFSGSTYRIYLLGNPVIWWGNLVFLALFVFIFVTNAINEQRGNVEKGQNNDSWVRFITSCNWLFLGWLLHYVPFWAMGRVLYFHHYFPALIFNSMLTGVLIDRIVSSLSRSREWLQHVLIGGTVAGVVYSFVLFSPLSYGMSGPHSSELNSTMHGLKWLESWEF